MVPFTEMGKDWGRRRFDKEGGGVCPVDLEVDRQFSQLDRQIRKSRVGDVIWTRVVFKTTQPGELI